MSADASRNDLKPAPTFATSASVFSRSRLDLAKPSRSHLGPGRTRVSDPGRYMFKFGWLTITADDLAVWQAYPNAAFTLIRTTAPAPPAAEEQPMGEEFRLGTFEIRIHSNYSESGQ